MKRVILYCRVSTDEQKNHGQSLSTQEAKLRAYCDLYDLEVVDVIVVGENSKDLHRDGLKRVLKMLDDGSADGLVVAKLDRLTRNIADWQTLINDYFSEKRGFNLYSVGDQIDTSTASGRLAVNLLVMIGQWERERIGERVQEVLNHKMDNNERCGSIRFGFNLDDDGKTLVPNATEQQVIGLIRELRDDGWSLRRIANELNERQIPTKKERRVWTHTTIQGILNRTAVLGRMSA